MKVRSSSVRATEPKKMTKTKSRLTFGTPCIIELNRGSDFSEINSITKPPPPPHPQGLMANPEFSNILKNSLFSQVDNFDHNKHLHISSSCALYQVNVSIGTAGVSSAGEMSTVRSPSCITRAWKRPILRFVSTEKTPAYWGLFLVKSAY